MHFYGSILVVEFSPGIQAKAQVNGRTVKSLDHIVQVNPEIIVFNVQRSCLLDEYLSKAHYQEVLPTGKLSYAVVTLVMIDTLLELVFWHKCH